MSSEAMTGMESTSTGAKHAHITGYREWDCMLCAPLEALTASARVS